MNSSSNYDRTILPSSADGNMVAVAARIQDRAMQLLSEQTKLNAAKTELKRIQDEAKKETQVNHSRRRKLLETTNSRNGVELELCKARGRINSYRKSIDILQQETQRTELETTKVQAQWQDDVKNIYSPHQLQMELYRKSLEAALEVNERRTIKRLKRLEQYGANSRRLKEEEGHLRQECSTLEAETLALAKSEEDGDEEVSSLATQVREALSKVSTW
jgi:chromosome segregation ATPase